MFKKAKLVPTLISTAALLAAVGFSTTAAADSHVKVALESTHVVKVRQAELRDTHNGLELVGRLTHKIMYRDDDQGYVSASVYNQQGQLLEEHTVPLFDQIDNRFTRFNQVRISLTSSADQIAEVRLKHHF